MQIKNSYQQALYSLVSLLGHAIVIGLMLTQFNFSKAVPKTGRTQDEVLPSYIYQSITETPKPEEKSLAKPIIKPAIILKKQLVTPVQQKKVIAQPPSAKPQPKMSGNNQAVSELKDLLHVAIQAHQHYPATALEMEREGRITLMFTLFKNGSIERLRIVKSSGTSSLDNAALAAVNDAVPFQHVDKYLPAPHEYQIDVVFELT